MPLIGDIISQIPANNKNTNEESSNSTNLYLSQSNGYCHYSGVLILIPYLTKVIEKGKKDILQWLVCLFLGVKNIEQSKILNFKSLNILLGHTTKNLYNQRNELKRQANEQSINDLIRLNIELIGAEKCTDFYYDPHCKHYSGMKKILKGWCSRIRFADKVINMDFIHTVDGYPVYINNTDNYDDLRIRFFKNIKALRDLAQISDKTELTYIVDRAIFSIETFQQVINMPNTHLVTWEKNYNYSAWNERQTTKKGNIIKYRNNSRDIKQINYTYQVNIWNKSEKIRQIVVRIEDPQGKTKIEVAILTDDLQRDADQIIHLMFNRWIQENDFKYLINHFGIDMITSYSSNKWEEIKDNVDDKYYISGEYKALTAEIDNIRGRLKTVLLKKHKYDKKYFGDDKKPTEKQNQVNKKNILQINELTALLEKKESIRTSTEKLISKNKELSDNNYYRLNTTVKLYMDIIKIIARNIYYLSFQEFKKSYNNFRDDHLIYRTIIKSNGYINYQNQIIQIHIIPEMELPPKLENILNRIFENMNRNNPILLDNSERQFQLIFNSNDVSLFATKI